MVVNSDSDLSKISEIILDNIKLEKIKYFQNRIDNFKNEIEVKIASFIFII